MNKIVFEKLSCYDKINEVLSVSIPFEEGKLYNENNISLSDGNKKLVSQKKVLSCWKDGSVKWLLVHFIGDLPRNSDKTFTYEFSEDDTKDTLKVIENKETVEVDTGKIKVILNQKGNIFNSIKGDISFSEDEIQGFILNDKYIAQITEGFKVIDRGPVLSVLEGKGKIDKYLEFIITLTFYNNKDDFKIDFRIINTYKDLEIKSLDIKFSKKCKNPNSVIGTSNYRTKFIQGENISYTIDADHLIYEANEHIPEVFYGVFFGDFTCENGGICGEINQAYQNFPKGISLDKNSLTLSIVPKGNSIDFLTGMSKVSTMYIYLHNNSVTKEDINIKCLDLEYKSYGRLNSKVYEKSGVFPDIFLEDNEKDYAVEKNLIFRFDTRAKAYGMLSYGDGADMHYTSQGRGNGEIVWCNNEYDFPHAAMLMYVRYPERRFLDYMLVSARHQMDIDVCRASDDEYRIGGMITHSAKHITGSVDISHEWVEGLLDYYHITGDKFAYDTAILIGDNIKKRLTLPRYHNEGEINARETGWALRAFVALYKETYDDKWLEDCDFIVGHFEIWKKRYGKWLSPYTDHSLIRIPFMISIAINSLMRYYSVNKDSKIKDMVLEAIDDIIDNCLLDNGLFYYKELPSLQRLANNPSVLEALSYAFELTGDKKYLLAGMETFKGYVSSGVGNYAYEKKKSGNCVILSGSSPKGISQGFLPVVKFYTLLQRNFKEDKNGSL